MSWGADTPPVDPVPPGHGESAAEINVGEPTCRCGMRLNPDGRCPIHGHRTSGSSKLRATITKPGIPGREEPYALLEDGRTMPMGRNMGKTFAVGTTGTAEYTSDYRSGLWFFTADPA